MQKLERAAELDIEPGRFEPRAEPVRAKGGLVRRHTPCSPDDLDPAFRPDLWVGEVRLAEREATPGPQMREGVLEAGVEIEVVQDADPDDRVELASLEPLTGLDVPDDDFRAVADSLAGDRCGRLAQLDRDELAAAREEARRELTGAATELEAADAGHKARLVDQEPPSPLGADRTRRARPAPDVLLAGGDQLALPALVFVALAYLGSRPCDSAYVTAASVIGSRRYGYSGEWRT